MNGYGLEDMQGLGEVTKGTKKKAGSKGSRGLRLPDFKTVGT
jgi:hypothetical protein